MAQQQDTPIHWDQAASRFNLTLIFSVVVAVLGIFMQTILLIILGIGMAGYSWLTTPRQFLLYRDSMVVVYGMPRTRVISFAEISHVELLALPLGERLRIRMVSGSRLMLMMRDPGTFRGHLEDALSRYHGEQTGAAYAEGNVLTRVGDPRFDNEPFDNELTETMDTQEFGAESEDLIESEYPGSSDGYSETRSGSYTEPDDSPDDPQIDDAPRVQEASSTSGSYSESPEPDYSGEGQSAYGAEIEVETSPREREEDPPEQPRSPY